jgi:protein ImuB
VTNHPSSTNPEPRIPNHDALYACLYEPPTTAPIDAGVLASLARDFSPRFEAHGPSLVVIDVSGLERLLGPARTVAEELRRAAAARSARLHVAVAGTQMAALVLARAQPGLTVVARGGEAAALAPIAIGILEHVDGEGAAVEACAAFARWGITTLGELAALPAADLVARLGRSALAWQAIARGDDVRPLVPALDEERFESAIELEWPIDGLEPLSFVLTRLLEPLSTRLERRDRGAAVLHVLLRLVTREVVHRRLELPTPLRDVRALRTLALLDLESHPPGAAIDRVTIVVDPTPGRVLQHTLFARAHPTPEQIATLTARLGALMGQDRIGAPAAVDSDRPGAFTMTPFATEHSARLTTADCRLPTDDCRLPTDVCAALRRCRQPVPARVAVAGGRPVRVTTDRRGFAGGAVVQCAGPWRTSGAWWAGGAAWDRDEWDVALNDGAVYRVFRDRESDAWFIDGIVD